jgi:hypothetical protein
VGVPPVCAASTRLELAERLTNQGRSVVLLTALLSREQVDADGVIKKQISGILTQDVCGLFREQGIGDDECGKES